MRSASGDLAPCTTTAANGAGERIMLLSALLRTSPVFLHEVTCGARSAPSFASASCVRGAAVSGMLRTPRRALAAGATFARKL
ncbi:MAG: hypothetical protein RLW61_20540 [Gammaproteobacteria bacterium]|jgi:hypothetical protein